MNKRVLTIVVVVLILLASGWYFMSSRKSPSPSTQSPTDTLQESAATSLKDLIGKGTAQMCTFSKNDSDGTVYVSGGKVREDFEVTIENQTVKSHVIIMDNAFYNWTDGQKTGIKMAFDPKATPPAVKSSDTAAGGGSFDADANLNYKCSAWIVDSTKFTLPTDVTFTSFALPSQGTPSTGNSSSSQCSYCDSLTGNDKVQCRVALKCN